jgi:hypothetical protein
MIRIEVDFLDERRFKNFTRYITGETANDAMVQLEIQIEELADASAKKMGQIIKDSKRRNSFGSNLEDNILSELVASVQTLKENYVEYGIGSISWLKGIAPYYEVLDAGGYIPYSSRKGAPLGSFEGDRPEATVVNLGQNWERSSDGKSGFFMKPKNPITGIGYIEQANIFVDGELKKIVESFGQHYIENLEKVSA